MKNILFICIFSILIGCFCAGCFSNDTEYATGSYIAVGPGYHRVLTNEVRYTTSGRY